jgi:hypothetical protein
VHGGLVWQVCVSIAQMSSIGQSSSMLQQVKPPPARQFLAQHRPPKHTLPSAAGLPPAQVASARQVAPVMQVLLDPQGWPASTVTLQVP